MEEKSRLFNSTNILPDTRGWSMEGRYSNNHWRNWKDNENQTLTPLSRCVGFYCTMCLEIILALLKPSQSAALCVWRFYSWCCYESFIFGWYDFQLWRSTYRESISIICLSFLILFAIRRRSFRVQRCRFVADRGGVYRFSNGFDTHIRNESDVIFLNRVWTGDQSTMIFEFLNPSSNFETSASCVFCFQKILIDFSTSRRCVMAKVQIWSIIKRSAYYSILLWIRRSLAVLIYALSTFPSFRLLVLLKR
jgi:hypothetical protein